MAGARMVELISGWIFAGPPPWLTLGEAETAFGCTQRTLKRRVATGLLRAKIVDGVCLVQHQPEARAAKSSRRLATRPRRTIPPGPARRRRKSA
jgi:hypothetical protein